MTLGSSPARHRRPVPFDNAVLSRSTLLFYPTRHRSHVLLDAAALLPCLLSAAILFPCPQVKKRVKGKGDDKKSKAFVTETVPCDSFFNTFDPPKVG